MLYEVITRRIAVLVAQRRDLRERAVRDLELGLIGRYVRERLGAAVVVTDLAAIDPHAIDAVKFDA